MTKFYIFKIAFDNCEIDDLTQMEEVSAVIYKVANPFKNPEDKIVALSETSPWLSIVNLKEMEYIKLGELELTDSSFSDWENVYTKIYESIANSMELLDNVYNSVEQELNFIMSISTSNSSLKSVQNASKKIKLKSSDIMNTTFFNLIGVLKKEFKIV